MIVTNFCISLKIWDGFGELCCTISKLQKVAFFIDNLSKSMIVHTRNGGEATRKARKKRLVVAQSPEQ